MGNEFRKNLKSNAMILAKIALATGLQMGTILGAKTLYDSFFPRYEKRDVDSVFGQFDYSRVN